MVLLYPRGLHIFILNIFMKYLTKNKIHLYKYNQIMEISEFMIEIIITINTFLAGFVLTSLNGRHRSEDDDLTERESTQIFWESLSFSVLMSNVILSFFVSNVSPIFSINTCLLYTSPSPRD